MSAVDPGAAQEKFDAATTIIGHVANTGLDHPIIHIPLVFGIDFSVTKHVFMVWLVATAIFVVLNGFFVAAEFGLVKVRPMRIDALVRSGEINALRFGARLVVTHAEVDRMLGEDPAA